MFPTLHAEKREGINVICMLFALPVYIALVAHTHAYLADLFWSAILIKYKPSALSHNPSQSLATTHVSMYGLVQYKVNIPAPIF